MPQSKKELNIQIGARIKFAREKAHFTQEKLAEAIGVSVQFTSDLERGKTGASVATIIQICRVLNVSSDFILLGQPREGSISSIQCRLDGLSPPQLQIAEDMLDVLLRAYDN